MKFWSGAVLLAAVCAAGLTTAIFAGPVEDTDGDGVPNVYDNCSVVKNGPPMDCDTDEDGYGNACDGDFDQNNLVSAGDFSSKFIPSFKKGVDLGRGTDMDCNGSVTAGDFSSRFVPNFKFGKPGPSNLYCAGTIPCDLTP